MLFIMHLNKNQLIRLLNFKITQITLSLVFGNILTHFFGITFWSALLLCFASLILMVTLQVFFKTKNLSYFGMLTCLCFVNIGIISYIINDDRIRKNHYTHYTSQNHTSFLKLKITERLKPNTHNERYYGDILCIDDKKISGRLLVNMKRDSLLKPLYIDDVILVATQLETVSQPLNPYQFNYKNYLELQQVYSQINIDKADIFSIKTKTTSIFGWADILRQTINKRLINAGFESDVLGIINALLLGQREDIDAKTYDNYINSGTIHILAVSGLHVGILFLILNWLLQPFLYLKYGRQIKSLTILLLLWAFAVVAGLSPSVARAVTIFSIVSFVMHLQRSTNIYNTLAISAFALLLINPLWLYHVGFQLSYLAVLGIVSLQPLLYKLWKPKFIIIDKLWQIFTVTLSAQIGVLPLSLFYFHQLPGLFFVSNLVIIPFLGIILGLGVLVIVLALLNILPTILATIYSEIITLLNQFIAWVASFEIFLFKELSFTIIQVIIVYVVVISLVQYLRGKAYKWALAGLVSVIVLQGSLLYYHYSYTQNSLTIFHKHNYSLIGKTENKQLTIYHNLNDSVIKKDRMLKNYRVEAAINNVKYDRLKSVYKYKNNTILIIDSLSVYKNLSFRPDYILLRNSPKINLNRVLKTLKPKLVIADGSNYNSYINRWETTCKIKNIPLYVTKEKGAYIFK